MSASCSQLDDFVDGILGENQLDDFGDHLADCSACQAGLEHRMQLDVAMTAHFSEGAEGATVAIGVAGAEGAAVAARAVSEGAAVATGAAGSEGAAVAAGVAGTAATTGASGTNAANAKNDTNATESADATDASGGAEIVPLPRKRRWWAIGGSPIAAAAALLLLFRPWDPSPEEQLVALMEQLPTQDHWVRVYGGDADKYRPLNPTLGGASKVPPDALAALAKLQSTGDRRAFAAAALFSGRLDEARAALADLPDDPAVLSDRAAIEVVAGNLPEALALTERALREDPKHPRALWNRGLALQRLGLNLVGAEAFQAAAEAGNESWRQASLDQAAALKKIETDFKTPWQNVWRKGDAWLAGGPPLVAKDGRVAGLTRHYFYEAARMVRRAAEIEPLRPLAQALSTRDRALIAYIEQLESADFRRRAPAAQAYREAAAKTRPWAEVVELAEQAGAQDILLGALSKMKGDDAAMQRYLDLARDLTDPGLRDRAAVAEARRMRGREDPVEVYRFLIDARARAVSDVMRARLDIELAMTALDLHLLDRADEYLDRGTKITLAAGEWSRHHWLQQNRVRAAAYRRQFALARALRLEVEARAKNHPPSRRFVREHVALSAIFEGRHLDVAPLFEDIGAPLSTAGVWALVDASRFADSPLTIEQVLPRVEEVQPESPDDELLRRALQGRLLIDEQPGDATTILQEVIEAVADDPLVGMQKARSVAYLSLQTDAARGGRYDDFIRLMAEELRAEPPSECVVAVGVDDERRAVAVRGVDGGVAGRYWPKGQRSALAARSSTFVPDDLRAALEGCPVVRVLAGPQLAGASDLLPPDWAWSFLLGSGHPRGKAAGHRLVVADVDMGREWAGVLPELPRYPVQVDGDTKVLRGPAATPGKVRAAMITASEIELYAHGMLGLGKSGASVLVLSEGEDGQGLLHAKDVESMRLEASPVVFLTACHGSAAGPQVHATLSLPSAFVRAGARAVFAADEEIPALEAVQVFQEIRDEVRRGTDPAVALQKSRVKKRADATFEWMNHLLVYSG